MKSQEKKQGRFGKVLGFLFSIVLLAAVSAAVVHFYPEMTAEAERMVEEKKAEKENLFAFPTPSGTTGLQPEYYDSDLAIQCNEYIAQMPYGMYLDWYYGRKDFAMGEAKLPGEVIRDSIIPKYAITADGEAWADSLSEAFTDWYWHEYPKLKSEMGVNFYISYGNSDVVEFSRFDDVWSQSAVLEAYPYAVRIKYDKEGVPDVIYERGTAGMLEQLLSYDEMINYNSIYGIDAYGTVRAPFRNMTLTIVSTGQSWADSSYVRNSGYHAWGVQGTWNDTGYNFWQLCAAIEQDYWIVVCVAVFAVFLLAMLLPLIRPFGLHRGWKANIPFELLCAAVTALIAILSEMPEMVLDTVWELKGDELSYIWSGIMASVMTRENERRMLYTLNGMAWFGVFSGLYLCFLSIRPLFAKGIVRYAKENTLIGIIVCFLTKKGVKFIRSIKNIDFEEKGNSFLWKAVLVNFVLVTLFCCTWFAGIIGAVVYSVILLLLLCGFWKKIKAQYESLLSVTKQMADGKINVEYTRDAGMFNSLKEELEKVQSGFEKAVREEVKSQRMKTELITNVSHDLKTPLTAIITYVDLLKNEELDAEERQAYIQVLEQKSARLKTLIEDLFEVSKANSGNVVLKQTPLDLTALLKEVQVELEDKIMASGIEFRMKAPEEKALALLDGEKTSRVFENLLGNIVKYGLPGSRAYLLVEQGKDTVRITLKNVSKMELDSDVEKLTERFTRGDASRTTEGSGLGLAIAKSFTEAQGGTLTLSADGDLFKVTVEFPAYAGKIPAEPVDNTVETETDYGKTVCEEQQPEYGTDTEALLQTTINTVEAERASEETECAEIAPEDAQGEKVE